MVRTDFARPVRALGARMGGLEAAELGGDIDEFFFGGNSQLRETPRLCLGLPCDRRRGGIRGGRRPCFPRPRVRVLRGHARGSVLS